jgi:hypothetical protein
MGNATFKSFDTIEGAISVIESLGMKPAFLGDANDLTVVAYVQTVIERTPEGPKVSYIPRSGVLTTFERVNAIPHAFIKFAINYEEPTNSAPNFHIWVYKTIGD